MDPLSDSLLIDLVSATEQGDVEHVRRLLALGVRPDVIEHSSGWSALHKSVLHDPRLLPTLLEYTANPDAPQVMGGTALSYVVHELGENPDDNRKQQLFEAIEVLSCMLEPIRRLEHRIRRHLNSLPCTICRMYMMPYLLNASCENGIAT